MGKIDTSLPTYPFDKSGDEINQILDNAATQSSVDAINERIGGDELNTGSATIIEAINKTYEKIDDFMDDDNYQKVTKIALAIDDNHQSIRELSETKTSYGDIFDSNTNYASVGEIEEDIKEIHSITEMLNGDKANAIIKTAGGLSNSSTAVTILDANGTYIGISGCTNTINAQHVGTTPTPDAPAIISGAFGIELNEKYVQLSNLLYKGDILDCYRGKIIRKMAIYTFTGDESFSIPSSGSLANRFSNTSCFPSNLVVHPESNSIVANIYCTHFQTKTYKDVVSDNYSDNSVALIGKGNHHITFSASGYSTVDNFKSFLVSEYEKGTPVQVLYELVVPIEIDAKDEGIDISEFEIHKGENSVYIQSDASGADFGVEYAVDTKTYIDNKFSELQTAILSTGGNV